MLKKVQSFIHSSAVLLAVLLLFAQCNQFNSSVPFPIAEKGYADPVTRPLTFSAPVAIQWSSVSTDSTIPMETSRFDFNSLPSKPFIIGEPQPLPKPVTGQKFDWNSIQDTAFNIETLPTQKLKFRTTRLGSPVVSKAGFASTVPGASRGVMEAGISFGLPGYARSFLQDKQHSLLWIGTNKGLCKYDGANIYVYATEQGLKDADLTSILEDKDGNIWVSTFSGIVYVFDFKAGLIKELIDTYPLSTSWAMIQDKAGQIWFTRNNVGVFIINTQKETLKQISKNEGLIDNSCIRVFQDREGIVWITSGNGFNAIDLKAGKLKRIQKQHGININFSIMVMQDKADRIWLAGNGGVNIIDKKKGTVKLLSVDQGLPAVAFAGLMEDHTGKIWIGSTTSQVFVYDEKATTLELIKLSEAGNNTVAHCLFEGRQGKIWIGTTATSSYYINTLDGRPGNFTRADGLGNNLVWSIKEDNNGYYWIGTRGGIDVYDPTTKTIKHIGVEQGFVRVINTCLTIDPAGRIWAGGNNNGISIIDIRKGTIHYLGRQQGLVGTGFTTLSLDKQGQMWITSNEGDVQVVDPNTYSIKRITNIPELNNRMDILKEDSHGNMWIGITGGGVSVVDKERKTIKNINTSRNLSSNDLTTMLEDSKGNMWIGTQRGLNVANIKDSSLTRFTTNEGLANNEIWTINEIGGKFYIGNTLGFSILSPTDKKSTLSKSWKASSYGKAQGLTYTDVAENGSYVTNKGQLWAGVDNQTLVIMDPPASDTFVPVPFITRMSVLDNPQIFSDKIAMEEALKKIDTLWKAEKDSFYANKKLPADTGYQLKNGIEWDGIEAPYGMPVNLHLPYHQNFVSFSFTANQTTNPDRVQYRYILEGIDKKWSPISSETVSENYRDLPPGDYTFKVAGMGMNGIWSKPASFKFSITPPWWKSWWAYLIYIILIGGLLYAIAQYRSRWLKKENRILEEKISHRTAQLKKTIDELQNTQSQLIQSEKMASLGELTAGIAHEIQNPLNFVNNFSDVNKELLEELKEEADKGNIDEVKAIAKDVIANEEKINHHGKRADAIVKGMLQHSRSSSNQKEPTDINALADEYLRLAYHGLRAKDKSFNSTMKTDFDETIGNINIVRQDIGRVFLNLINNAFYAVDEKKKSAIENYEPTVTVSTKKEGNKVLITVKDNGNGIPQKIVDKIFQPFFTTKPTGQGTGLGLSLSYDIVKAHGGEIKVETKPALDRSDGEGEGSTFIILLRNEK